LKSVSISYVLKKYEYLIFTENVHKNHSLLILPEGLSKKADHRRRHFLWERLSSRDSAVD